MAFRDFSSLRTHFRAAFCNRLRVGTRFSLLKYGPRGELSLNCGSPTLRFSEVLDFLSRSACDIPLLGQQRSRSCSKTTQNPRSLSRCAMCSARIFKAACPLFDFSCSVPFTNGFSWGYVSAIDSSGRTIWIVDAHGYGKRFIVRAEEILTAFLETETAIHQLAVDAMS